ncbi:hypothetical protein HD554DRAFT_2322998 [Boletus coccyginus]|nr:hypothetical protein HD554DRAFT_2322998 [Boletus coccyginus]
MHKRKHRKSNRDEEQECESAHTSTATSHVQSSFSHESLDAPTPDPCLYIQAHEADVIRGPPAVSAHFLECQDPTIPVTTGNYSRSGLIRWGPPEHSGDADTANIKRPLLWRFGGNAGHMRYDVRLLLDHFPDFQSDGIQLRPLSPSGWSDLPSDSEDTFFFSPDELEDYRREKRRRLIDRSREERSRALATIDGQEEDPDPWGGSDEEDLANYGTDKRFAFLRGRWSRVWRTEKESETTSGGRNEKDPASNRSHIPRRASWLGDSDTDGEESADIPTTEPEDVTDTACTQDDHSNEDLVKEARRARARAREWSAPRRVEQSESHNDVRMHYFITPRVEGFLDEVT